MATLELNVRVARKAREADDIASFLLIAADNGHLPRFEPGAHIDVHIPGGLIRQYSLCSLSTDPRSYEIAVLREPASRGGSVAMHDRVQTGDTLRISAPRNHFPLRPNASKSLLLAGGIGVTPLLCMAQHLSASGADFGMHYWSRTRARTAFYERIQRSAFAADVAFHFDDGPSNQLLPLEAALADGCDDWDVYLCGPAGFITAAREAAQQRGWTADRIHLEYFTPQAGRLPDSAAFEIELARSGRVLRVPANKTVAQVLAEHSVNIPLSCEQGVCGTCLTRILSGIPDHRDLVLTPEEHARNDQFTPCCSRALSPRLVLDL